jgi:hypothetical protein
MREIGMRWPGAGSGLLVRCKHGRRSWSTVKCGEVAFLV